MATPLETIEAINGYYDRAKGAYERWGAGTGAIHFGWYPDGPETATMSHPHSLLATSQLVLSLARVEAGQTVVDQGCGFGHLSREIAARQARAIGINISKDQLTEAKRQTPSHLSEFISYLHADFANTQLSTGIAQAVVFLETLVHSPIKDAVLKEARRITQKGGRLVIADYFIEAGKNPADERIKIVNTGWKLEIAPLETILEALKESGFKAETTNITTNMQPSFDLAAASSQAHDGEDAPQDIRSHRAATIEIAKLMREGILGYYTIASTAI